MARDTVDMLWLGVSVWTLFFISDGEPGYFQDSLNICELGRGPPYIKIYNKKSW